MCTRVWCICHGASYSISLPLHLDGLLSRLQRDLSRSRLALARITSSRWHLKHWKVEQRSMCGPFDGNNIKRYCLGWQLFSDGLIPTKILFEILASALGMARCRRQVTKTVFKAPLAYIHTYIHTERYIALDSVIVIGHLTATLYYTR